MTRARYKLTVPGPSYPWFCRALVHANHGHLVHPDGTRHPQQVIDAQPVTGGTLVEFEAEIPTNLLDCAATTIAQPEHLTPTDVEHARGWGKARTLADALDALQLPIVTDERMPKGVAAFVLDGKLVAATKFEAEHNATP